MTRARAIGPLVGPAMLWRRLMFLSTLVVAAALLGAATPSPAHAQNCYNIPPDPGCYMVSVSANGSSTPTRTAYTGGYSATYTVTNAGIMRDTYSIACAGSSNVTCTGTSITSVTLNSGAHTTVTAYYSVGAPGTGTLTLSASSNNQAYDSDYWTVPVVSYGVSLTPDGATSATRAANTGGYSESFTI